MGPATIHVKGCFQRGSISNTEQLLFTPSFLYVQLRCTISVGENFALSVEIGKDVSFLDIRYDGGVLHPEATIDPATTATIGKNSEETVLVVVRSACPFTLPEVPC